MLADYFYTKADVYFLQGWYSSMYDDDLEEVHVPADWLERFGTNFRPSHHARLDQGGHADQVREILPWLRLAVEVDPHHLNSYKDGAFILRKVMKRSDDAASFLREGIAANPGEPSLLFELGHLFYAESREPERTMALWERALDQVDRSSKMDFQTKRAFRKKIVTYLNALKDEEENPAEVSAVDFEKSQKAANHCLP